MLKERIKILRSNLEISQAELAKLVNVSQQTIGSWEVGRTEPDAQQINKLSNIFEVSTDYLLGNTDDPTPPSKKGEKKEAKAASESDIKYAFFSGVPDEVSDKMFDQMKEYAEFLNVKYKDEIEKAKEKNE